MNDEKKKARRLSKFKVDETSLVDAGANGLSFYARKSHSHGGSLMKDAQVIQAVLSREIENREAVRKSLTDLGLDSDATDGVEAVIKIAGAVKDHVGKDGVLAVVVKAVGLEMPKAEKVEAGGLDESTLPEPVRKALETERAERIKLEKQLKDADERRVNAEFVEKSTGLKALGKPEDIAKILKGVHDKAPDSVEPVVALLKNAATLVENGKAFEELGSNQGGGEGGGVEKIRKSAREWADKNGHASITTEQAVAKFIKTDEGRALLKERKSSYEK